jgi:hypothetical protein
MSAEIVIAEGKFGIIMSVWKSKAAVGSIAILSAATIYGGFAAGNWVEVTFSPPPVVVKTTRIVTPAVVVDTSGKLPAEKFINTVLGDNYAGMKRTGERQPVALTPTGYACGRMEAPPAISGMRQYNTSDGARILAVDVYISGAGAGAFKAIMNGVQSCPERGAWVSQWAVNTVGVEGAMVTVTRQNGRKTSTVYWREGDVVFKLSGGNTANLVSQAETVNKNTRKSLTEVCSDTKSSKRDASRSPWLGNYKQHSAVYTIALNAVPEPQPTDLTVPYVSQLAPPLTINTVTRPTPPGEPFWPDGLPKEPATPVKPSPPGDQVTWKEVHVQAEDVTGPGCGWVFTGQTAPVYDREKTAADLETKTLAAEEWVRGKQTEWVAAMNEYYVQWAEYEKDAKKWNKYARKVTKTTAAWNVIRADQERYAAELVKYNTAVAAKGVFLTQQATAKQFYADTFVYCANRPDSTPAPTVTAPAPPKPKPSVTNPTTPTPTVTPTVTVTPTPTPVVTNPEIATPTPSVTTEGYPRGVTGYSCPPVKPAILGMKPPTIPTKPVPPADPRPKAAPVTETLASRIR